MYDNRIVSEHQVLYNGLGIELLSKYTTVAPLSDERKALYLFLSSFYGVRWAFGMLTMMGEVPMDIGVFVGLSHLCCPTMFSVWASGKHRTIL